uniref:Ectonucleotide pyrophosphatase/phosphodiesterase 1 n=1 Tax=Oryzias sinensis TaxID=183150 RepID=A0A8C8DD49_9TELE
MEKASCEKAVFVSNYLPHTSDFEVIQGPAARIRPKRLPEDYFSCEFLSSLPSLMEICFKPCCLPYLKEHLPKRMHFANNIRIERGHLYMKPGCGGFHGSDNIFTNMQGIFIGYGPGFLQNTIVPPFENIEVYNLMCDLLNIRPAPNNGTHGSLNHLLKNPVHHPVHPAQLSHETPCEAAEPAPTYSLHCNCSFQINSSVQLLKNLSQRRVHHPYGTPGVVQSGANFCLLYHPDYINGYSKDRLMPLWVSYSIRPPKQRSEGDVCIRADVRVPQASSQQCLQYKDDRSLTYGLLHPYCNFSGPETDSLIGTNMVPMFPAFKKVWDYIHQSLLPKYSQQLNGINILSGPIFDTDYDGNVDPIKEVSGNEAPIPTHFFLILNSCQNLTLLPTNCVSPLKVQSFILPHRPDYSEVCKSDLEFVESWMSFHTARVRDIELLTGLSFYHSRISVEETLQLKTFLDTQRAIENS